VIQQKKATNKPNDEIKVNERAAAFSLKLIGS